MDTGLPVVAEVLSGRGRILTNATEAIATPRDDHDLGHVVCRIAEVDRVLHPGGIESTLTVDHEHLLVTKNKCQSSSSELSLLR